jgi:RNA polymerase sigma factor (sigma-70 family)
MTSVTPRTRARSNGQQLAETLRSAGTRDYRAWARLVEEFSGMVWAIARAHRLSNADAADVAQSTWLRLLEQLDSIREPERVGAWLATTARRECLRVLRMADRQVLSGDELPGADCTDSALEDMLRAERDEALWRAFSRLRASDQALLRLLMADPRPAYEEISAALDMPIGSIGPTRARALQRLRDELDREAGVPPRDVQPATPSSESSSAR